jgi:hypothetical protein
LILSDFAERVRGVLDSLNEPLALAEAFQVCLALKIAEYLILSELALRTGTMGEGLGEGITLADLTERGWSKVIEESMVGSDAALLTWLLGAALAESLTAQDSLAASLTLTLVVPDIVYAADALSYGQVLQGILQDGLYFYADLVLDGAIYQCWVLNTKEFHPSVYSGFDFNSFCRFQGVPYGARADGIYRLDGSTDEGKAIHSGIVLSNTDFGLENFKRFRKAALGVSASGVPLLKVETEDGSSKVFEVQQKQASITRDLKGRRWTFSLAEFDELDFIELFPVVLAR